MTALFVFGTLRHPGLLQIVAGPHPATRQAILPDHAVRGVRDQDFPILVQSPGRQADGLLLDGLSAEAHARIDFYETLFGYGRHAVQVETESGPRQAEVYLPPEGQWQVDGTWSLEQWTAREAEMSCAAAEEVMARRTQAAPDVLARLHPFMRARAWSRHLAARSPTPTTLRHRAGEGDVQLAAQTTPFSGFFQMRQFDVAARKFRGGMGPPVSRECFISYDAALVLPYDPVSDRVLMVEQLRFGPLMRGDPQPWALEPVAGLVDAGETPEAAALRETREEAGLVLSELRPIAAGYPAPGYVTEYYHCFLGLTDLVPGDAGIGGLASEHEDIASHVVSFEAAMALVESGEITTLPLIMMLLWLARHRDALRAEAARP